MIILGVLFNFIHSLIKNNKDQARVLKFMKKIFISLTLMFLLVGCVESIAVIGGGAGNGKLVQSSFQSGISLGIKKQTGKSPLQHALSYSKKKKPQTKEEPCSSFINKKDLEICLMAKERIISNHTEIKEKKFLEKHLQKSTSYLQSSIDEKSKIKYLD